MKRSALRADGGLLLAAFVWGTAFVAQRKGLDHVGPLSYNALRFALGSLLLLPLALREKPLTTKDKARDEHLWIYVFIAGTILTVGSALQQTGLLYTTAGKAGFITGLYVVIVPFLGLCIGHRIGGGVWAGSFLATVGLYFLSVTEAMTIGWGDLLVLGSAFLWLRKNEPENWARVDKVIQNQDYILRALGAEEYFVDIPDAGFYGIWDPYKHEWSKELMDLFDIDEAILPKATPSSTRVGAISAGAAKQSGFAEGTPLCVGAGDQNSAAVGAGIVAPGFLSVSMGTAGSATAFLDKPFRDPKAVSMVTNHATYGRWQLEGYQASAAGIYRWFRDEVATLEKAYAKESKQDVYDLLNKLVADTPTGARGLVFLPYFASATSPRWNPHARGTLMGLTFNHDRGCLARAIIEGITLDMRDILTEMDTSGVDIRTVRLLGGPTKSPLWNQIHADVYNRPVETLRTTDAAVLGAAILGGVGVGLFSDIAEAASHMVRVGDRYEPIAANASIYDELYDVYCKTYEGLEEKKAFRALADLQERL